MKLYNERSFRTPRDTRRKRIRRTRSSGTVRNEAATDKPTIDDQLAPLLESNRLLQQTLLGRMGRLQKPMPEKFDGRTGDFIEAWLEQSSNLIDSGPTMARLGQLLQKYKNIFREELPEGLPPNRVVDHAIDTGNYSPVNKPVYQLSVQQLQE